MIDWSDIEDALHTWLETALAPLGVAANRILWSDQDMQRGTGTLVLVRRGDLIPVVPPCVTQIDHSDDGPPPANGSEIELRTEQTFALTITLQAFDSRMVGDVTGAALLHEARLALSLPTVRSALHAAGLFCFDNGTSGVRNVSELIEGGPDFESRAVVDVRFYLNDSRSEFVGYFEQVELTQTVDGVALPAITLKVE